MVAQEEKGMNWYCVHSALRSVEADWLIVPVMEEGPTSAAQELDELIGGLISR